LERGGEGALTAAKRNQSTSNKGSEKKEKKVGNSFWRE
jgi:hypothetical protein